MTRSDAERDIRRSIRIEEERALAAKRSAEAHNKAPERLLAQRSPEAHNKAPAKKNVRKFQTQKQQRDELVRIYESEHGLGSAKKLFDRRLADKKTLLKAQINLLCGLVAISKPAAPAKTLNPAPHTRPATTPAASLPAKPYVAANCKLMTRAEFEKLTPSKKTEFILLRGGRLTD